MATNSTIPTLITQLNELCPQLASEEDNSAKIEALQIIRKLSTSLAEPANVAVDLAFSPFISVAARIAINLELFKHISSQRSPINSKQLAKLSGGEELLIIRVLRPLSAIGFVQEVGKREWEPSLITHAMASDEIAAGHRMIGEMIVGAAQKAPKFFETHGHRCPTDPYHGLMQYAFQTNMTTFELFSTMPQILKDFNLFMGNTMGARHYWVDWYPVGSQLLDNLKNDTPLLVDVGAGKGHDLIAFLDKYPGKGNVVLQDLPHVIDGLEGLDSVVEVMSYDFFTEQPIRGARAYFYHHILHDWSDEKCLKILEHVKNAMSPEYSKLLIHEMVVPEVGASTFHAMLDMTMMAFNAGMERTEQQWKDLLQKAGLVVVKVWSPLQEDGDAIIEAVLAEQS